VPGKLEDLDAGHEITRAAALVNLYEGMIAGEGPSAVAYFERLLLLVQAEENQLLLDLAIDQLSRIFWQFLPAADRDTLAPRVERVLWESMLAHPDPGVRKIYFRAFVDVALTADAIASARDVWAGNNEIDDLPLAENDLIDALQALAVKLPGEADALIALQLDRTENPDNTRKLEFLAPSLSADAAVRDQFFASLADASNRETESWVLVALANLHHPLRLPEAEGYIGPSLDLLEEIQVTGDIFFPKRWLDMMFRYHRSGPAAATVRGFLAARPEYNEQLRMKIEQSAHMMFRASAMLDDGEATPGR
jgi:aminopeptidase N